VRGQPTDGQRRFTRADAVALSLGVVALLAGVALLLATSGQVAQVVGIGLIGLAAVAFVSLVFLVVGESEDRDYQDKAP
jgi:hypothetical protein